MDVQVSLMPTRVKSYCPVCGESFIQVIGNGSVQRYCSPRCREEARRQRKSERLLEQQVIVNSNMTDDEQKRMTELEELVDGCYTIVELHTPSSPAQKQWKQNWLDKAKRLVPSAPEW